MDLTGQKLGKYELLEKLGQGGMAQVYKARQPLIERLVAIKVMQTHLTDSEQFVNRFLREAQRLCQLRHPNIVSILDFDIVGGTHFLVMDFVSGSSLENYLEVQRVLTPVEALRISSQIANALQYAHVKGVVHCDLKPANVMFQDATYQQVVLTDFGIARILDTSGQAQTSTVIGTPSYISPEAAQGLPLDGRADIYSLGVMMYEMVAGGPPFIADSQLSVMMKHLQEPVPNLRLTHPHVPETYIQIVEKALAKAPADRFRSAADMHLAIEAALGNPSGKITNISGSVSQEAQFVSPVGARLSQSVAAAPGSAMAAPGVTSSPAKKSSFSWLWIGVIGFAILTMLVVGGIGIALISSSISKKDAPVAIATNIGSTSTEAAGGLTPIQTQPGGSLQVSPTAEVLNVEPGRAGSVFILSNSEGFPSQVSVDLPGIAPPPSGKTYVLWIGDGQEFSNTGELKIESRHGFLTAPIADSQLGKFSQAKITLETSGTNPGSPSNEMVYQGAFSDERLAEFRFLQLGSSEATKKAYLYGVFEQAAAANYHQVYSLDALNKSNLAEAKAHAEHTVNILEGKNGPDYGDLDGNGKVENPGDDVGVKQYIAGAIQHLQASANTSPQTILQKNLVEKTVALYEQSLNSMQKVIDLNKQALAANTVEEMLPLTQQASQAFNALMYGEDGISGIWWGNNYANRAIEMSLISPNSSANLPGSESEEVASGTFKVDEKNDFTFQVHNLSVAPKGMSYVLWASEPGSGKFENLGVIPPDTLETSGNTPVDLYSAYTQVNLSIEPESTETIQSPTHILLSGGISPASKDFFLQMTSTTAGAPLEKAEEQAGIAQEHMQFLFEAFNSNNLPLAKRHAEHIMNVLEGEAGPNFGDINGDGTLQNPGDQEGVLGYLQKIQEAAEALKNQNLSNTQLEKVDELIKAKQAVTETISACYDAASKVIASDTIEEAKSNAEKYDACVQAVFNGRDTNGDGVIDPFATEGGLTTIRQLSESIGWIDLSMVQ